MQKNGPVVVDRLNSIVCSAMRIKDIMTHERDTRYVEDDYSLTYLSKLTNIQEAISKLEDLIMREL